MPDKLNPYCVLPPEGDPKVGQEVLRIVALIVQDKLKMGLHDRWWRNYQLRRNQHWKGASPQGVPLVTANVIFTHVQRTVNTLTDNNPTFNVAIVGKLEEGQKDLLMDLQRCTEHWWTDQEQQDILETSCLNGEQYGPAIEKLKWNSELEYGIGEAETVPIDPFNFGWYPVKMANARDLQGREVIVHYYAESVNYLKRQYPKLADKIKPEKELLKEFMEDERREISAGDKKMGEGGGSGTLISIASAVKELVSYIAGKGDDTEEYTLVCEAWVKDRTPANRTVERKNGEKEPVTEPKYTGEIRYVLACSGGLVLEDKDNPNVNAKLPREEARNTYLFDKRPFSMVASIKDTSNAWGFSDLEQIEWLCMELNKSLSQFVLEKDRSARKKIVNPKDSGVENHEFTNVAGIIRPATTMSAQGVRWLEPPASSVDYDKGIAIFKDLIFLISGTFELDQAQVKGREVIAYKAIAALLERASTMMRGKIRAYSRLIRERGRMYISMVQNFYTDERWITYQENGITKSKAINGSDLLIPARLTVVSGSTMPISRVAQREEAITLATSGFIDQEELLEKLDWGNRAEVLKRMQAGPIGQMLELLAQAGMPPAFLQYIQQIAQADPKKLMKAIESGEFPSFQEFAQKVAAETQGQPEQDPAQDAEFQERQAKVKKAMAEAEKALAERDLIIEKTVTERVEQQVKMAGVGFDEEKMEMERAKIVQAIENDAHSRHSEGVKMGLDLVSAQNNKPGYNERGLKSNNQE